MMEHWLHIFVTTALASVCLANYFCNLPCEKDENTVCRRKPCGCSERCGVHFRMLPIDGGARKVLIDLHNKYRSTIANGYSIPGTSIKLPSATDMIRLNYDQELEFVAQCYANACMEWGAHDKCRRTSKFQAAGQNMYTTYGSGNFNFSDEKYIEEAVTSWFNEVKDMEPDVVNSYRPTGKVIGHFTQLAWARTSHIGCARTMYGNRNIKGMYLYCNYGPGGNILGGTMYQAGSPGDSCSIRSETYKNLCVHSNKVTEHEGDDWEDWEPPFPILE
ncbi:hypothetical protein PPYR_07772 [Photinus pyralis]|uniref:SCP domain-containing protein n=1 Tax=Photinus pyralis TaxID=7054 RepID=A0A5N4ARB3_PHOPY|nr:venom allergen 5-like [Photinus pyralis]KAB0799892.1 hypothetical protein PPYR_07772 [Photinus pyralis]